MTILLKFAHCQIVFKTQRKSSHFDINKFQIPVILSLKPFGTSIDILSETLLN